MFQCIYMLIVIKMRRSELLEVPVQFIFLKIYHASEHFYNYSVLVI